MPLSVRFLLLSAILLFRTNADLFTPADVSFISKIG